LWHWMTMQWRKKFYTNSNLWHRHRKKNVFDSKISGTRSEMAPVYTTSSVKSQAISDSSCDMQEQLNNSLLVNTEGKWSVFSTWVFLTEIYNENVYDLLEPIGSRRQKRQNLTLGEDKIG
jgi:hypothetical protein